MKLAFFVNRVETEIPEYTTNRLALAAARGGHDVWLVGAGDVAQAPDGTLSARAQRATYEGNDSLEAFLETTRSEAGTELIDLADLDVFMLRNDSVEDLHERPWAAPLGMLFGRLLAQSGVVVVNDPVGLLRASTKLYLQTFPPDIRPACIVTRDAEEIRAFLAETGSAVLKPLQGAKGRNVFLVRHHEDSNLNQIIEAVLEDGYVMAQQYVEGAERGDTRLFLLDGRPLHAEGRYAAFRRMPPEEDVRSNISTGGRSVEASIGETELAIAAAMRDRLVEDGMFFVGIDIVGDKVVEINAESPGGFQSAEHFTGVDFAPVVIGALERRLS